MSDRWDIYDESIAGLVRADPIMAFARVPTGITAYWAASLGYPAWLVDGTAFSPGAPLPGTIRLIEDLQLMANLLRHEGEEQLIEMMLAMPRFPGDREILTAPDLRSALDHAAGKVNRGNHIVDIAFSVRSGRGIVEFEIIPVLGAFRSLHEKVLFIWLFQIVRSFAGLSHAPMSELASIHIEEAHGDVTLSGTVPCNVLPGAPRSVCVFPELLLGLASPDFEPATWAQYSNGPDTRTVGGERSKAIERRGIEEAILFSLREHARVPQLAEIARMFGMPQRSFGRMLEREGLSFRALLDDTRMALARELLAEETISVRAVSERLGYSDITAFSRSFRRRFGISPMRWRRSQRNHSIPLGNQQSASLSVSADPKLA